MLDTIVYVSLALIAVLCLINANQVKSVDFLKGFLHIDFFNTNSEIHDQ